ncbi:MAG TPA: hypothetical protein VFT72_16270 [Opitutaceae bacterium]|nr:hypothetical protein [Opitutaceae bacterium]
MFRFHLALLLTAVCATAGTTWHSVATNSEVPISVLEPSANPGGDTTTAHVKQAPPVIIYLQNLPTPRVGTDSDESILHDFRAEGFLVVTLDYAHQSRARWPFINRDFTALREQVQKKTFLDGRALDTLHIFIVPSGHRLKRDVVFYREAKRTLALDLIYPSHPAKPVGAVLEFSCDNKNRMSNFSLNFCTDTMLEGAATEGFAVAMADHPVPAPYAGLDAMPECAWKTKAAVRTLRAQSGALGLNGRIVPVGFSRGSGMALLLATTRSRAEFEGHGEHLGTDSSVQGAVVLSGRFTYLDLLANDKMIPRYNAAWGERATHEQRWRSQGALDYLTAPTEPLFLSINCTESPDALHQMEVLRHRLTELSSPFEYHLDEEPRGHRVPLTPAVLDPMLSYLKRQLASDPSIYFSHKEAPEGRKKG